MDESPFAFHPKDIKPPSYCCCCFRRVHQLQTVIWAIACHLNRGKGISNKRDKTPLWYEYQLHPQTPSSKIIKRLGSCAIKPSRRDEGTAEPRGKYREHKVVAPSSDKQAATACIGVCRATGVCPQLLCMQNATPPVIWSPCCPSLEWHVCC